MKPSARSVEINKLALEFYDQLLNKKIPSLEEGQEDTNLTCNEALDIAATLITLMTTKIAKNREEHIIVLHRIGEVTLAAFDEAMEIQKLEEVEKSKEYQDRINSDEANGGISTTVH